MGLDVQTERGGYVGRIPIRNLWLLMLYASRLFRQQDQRKIETEDNPEEIPDLVAEILCRAVEKRLRRNLSHAYAHREDVLNRVRGRIDFLRTSTHRLLDKGQVACRFDELTVDTPRNRFVKGALSHLTRLVGRAELAHRSRSLVTSLRQIGVVGAPPTVAQIQAERFGHHDKEDQHMVSAALLAYQLALPTEMAGQNLLNAPDREIRWLRGLFEKAVCGFFDVVLSPHGWNVRGGKHLNWPIDQHTRRIGDILPSMITDIELTHLTLGRRIVIDTKFNALLTQGRYRDETLRSGYLYQIYAYLRSQADLGDPLNLNASGVLLHPAVEEMVNEAVLMHGHEIKFMTVDLSASPTHIRRQLVGVLNSEFYDHAGIEI